MYRIYPYNMNSESSRNLAEHLDAFRVYPDRAYRANADHLVINWGNSHAPTWNAPHYLNNHDAVATAVNKLLTLQALISADIRVPMFTSDIVEVYRWIRMGVLVYCRTNLTGHGGDGIVIANTLSNIVQAPLYVANVPCRAEYRIHVFRGRVIDYSKKVINGDTGDADQFIRNHEHGWTFARNIENRDDVSQIAIDAVNALGLDFGAVDIIVNETDNLPYVLEVNTSPGLMEDGRTLEAYVNAFREYHDQLFNIAPIPSLGAMETSEEEDALNRARRILAENGYTEDEINRIMNHN